MILSKNEARAEALTIHSVRQKYWRKLSKGEKATKRSFIVQDEQPAFALDLNNRGNTDGNTHFSLPSTAPRLQNKYQTPSTPFQSPESENPNTYYPDIRKKGAAKLTIHGIEVRPARKQFQESKGLDRKFEHRPIPPIKIPSNIDQLAQEKYPHFQRNPITAPISKLLYLVNDLHLSFEEVLEVLGSPIEQAEFIYNEARYQLLIINS